MVVESHRDVTETRARLADWLAGILDVEQVEVGELTVPGLSGYSNETLIFDASWDPGDGPRTEGLVVRVEPSEGGHRVFPSTAFDEQVRVIEALGAEGSVPVPPVVAFEQDTSVLGARFLAMGTRGRPGSRRQSQLPRPGLAVRAGCRSAAAGLVERGRGDSRHPPPRPRGDRPRVGRGEGTRRPRSPPTAPMPPGPARAGPYLAATTRSRSWRRACRRPRSIPRCAGAIRACGNILFDDQQRVAAVLDWEMLLAGDPVQDLAWYLVIDRHHHEGFGVPRLAALPGRDETAARWSELTGRSTEHLGWYELLGAVRFAAIMTRVLLLLERDGLFPGASELAFDHGASALVHAMLEERA